MLDAFFSLLLILLMPKPFHFTMNSHAHAENADARTSAPRAASALIC